MRFNAFTFMIIALTTLAIGGLGAWSYLAHVVAQNPDDSLSDKLALASIWTAIISTGLITYWWHGYIANDGGIELRYYSVLAIFLTAVAIMLVFGTAGFVYGFGVWITAILSVYWGFVTFPDYTVD